MTGPRAQGRAQALGGQVGRLPPGGEQEETAVLHDELQTLDALGGAPTDPVIAILERVATGSPDQQRDGLAVLLDELTQIIADGPARAQVMVGGQLRVERDHLVGLGHPDGECGRRLACG